jgi:hypothetical protein
MKSTANKLSRCRGTRSKVKVKVKVKEGVVKVGVVGAVHESFRDRWGDSVCGSVCGGIGECARRTLK